MGDSSTYWEWRDDVLRHEAGRAVGGEPCVVCGEPVAAEAHWKHRDRHVCSKRCNTVMARRFTRRRQRGEFPTAPDPMPDPRVDLEPRVFLEGEFEGFGPRSGDVVIRGGVATFYRRVPAEEMAAPSAHAPDGLLVAVHASGHMLAVAADPLGRGTRVRHGEFGPEGRVAATGQPFESDGIQLVWRRELIRDVGGDGRAFTWEAHVCVPVDWEGPGRWSEAYAEASEQRRRVSASAARHARRVRVEAATVERFDPREVFDRDGWRCGLCGEAIDPGRRWPDPMAVSLDHVVPLAAGGDHSRANTQAAHWICNVKKGVRL